VASIENIFGSDLDNLQNAMSRATRRHALIADNLANVNTAGYKRKDIDFNIILNAKMNQSKVHEQEMKDQQAQEASDRTSLRIDGNNVDMEREVMSMSETELRYDTLANLTQSYFSNMKSVIREGK